ncbi:hypothetical protein C8Q80DRAFT_914234 [Daedaleopsis nitida]|nr:hypothetical protein C8Q80DRAFT_914234 [Daedaleopsis nitida]
MTTILPMDYSWSSPVRISNLTEVKQPWGDLPSKYYKVEIAEAKNVNAPWTGQPPARITFRVDEVLSASHCGQFVLQLGKCFAHHDRRQEGSDRDCLWVSIQPDNSNAPHRSAHECPEDHILQWSDLKKTFTLGEAVDHPGEVYKLTVSFTPCPLNPTKTLAMQPIGVSAVTSHVATAESETALSLDASDEHWSWEDFGIDISGNPKEETSALQYPATNTGGSLAIGSTAPLSITRDR